VTRRHDGNGRWRGPERAASRPAELLAVRGDLDGLRTRTAADGGSAARQLVELMTQQSQFEKRSSCSDSA